MRRPRTTCVMHAALNHAGRSTGGKAAGRRTSQGAEARPGAGRHPERAPADEHRLSRSRSRTSHERPAPAEQCPCERRMPSDPAPARVSDCRGRRSRRPVPGNAGSMALADSPIIPALRPNSTEHFRRERARSALDIAPTDRWSRCRALRPLQEARGQMAEPIRCPHAEPGSAPAGPNASRPPARLRRCGSAAAHDGAGYVSGAA